MTTAATLATAPRPIATVIVPVSAWKSTWKRRPLDDETIGLRSLSLDEAMTAEAEAARVGAEVGGDDGVARYNQELMVWAVGYAACDPNDANKRYFDLGEGDARYALTPAGVKHLFDEFYVAQTINSPVSPQADDDDLADLCDRLIDADLMAALSERKDARVRRLAKALLDLLIAEDV